MPETNWRRRLFWLILVIAVLFIVVNLYLGSTRLQD